MSRTIRISRGIAFFVFAVGACASPSNVGLDASETTPSNEHDATERSIDSPARDDDGAPSASPTAPHKPDAGTSTDASSDDAGTTITDAGIAVPACSTEQMTPELSAAEKHAVIQKFIARNGSGWAPTAATPEPFSAYTYFPALGLGQRTDAAGPAVSLTKAQATATALAFLRTNWDLLGFRTQAGAAAITGGMDLQDGDPGGFHLQFDSTETQPGYEHIKNGALWLRLRIQVGSDGTVRAFEQGAVGFFPPLTMSPYPTIMTADQFRAKLNGLPLYNTNQKVSAADKVNLGAIALWPMKGGQKLVLDYWLERNKKVYKWTIDGCTAAVLGTGVDG